MKKIAFAFAAVLLASSPVLALDFSSTLVYPTQAAPTVDQTALRTARRLFKDVVFTP